VETSKKKKKKSSLEERMDSIKVCKHWITSSRRWQDPKLVKIQR